VQQQVLDVAKSQDTVATQLSEVEKVAKAAHTAVKGTVIAGVTVGDNTEGETVTQKSDVPSYGLIDTAYPGHRGHRTTKSQKH